MSEVDYESAFKKFAYYFILINEGSDYYEEAYDMLKELGWVDELGFWIGD